ACAPSWLRRHPRASVAFSPAILPGCHPPTLPPYFVAGAIFSGFAMVVTLLVILRKVFRMEEYITILHLENMNKIILVTGMMVGYAYATEFFVALYSQNPYERLTFMNRATGPVVWAYWPVVTGHGIGPQIVWSRKL